VYSYGGTFIRFPEDALHEVIYRPFPFSHSNSVSPLPLMLQSPPQFLPVSSDGKVTLPLPCRSHFLPFDLSVFPADYGHPLKTCSPLGPSFEVRQMDGPPSGEVPPSPFHYDRFHPVGFPPEISMPHSDPLFRQNPFLFERCSPFPCHAVPRSRSRTLQARVSTVPNLPCRSRASAP